MFEPISPVLSALLSCLLLLAAPVPTHFLSAAQQTAAPSPAPAAELRINGAVSTPLVLTVADLKNMPRKTLTVVNPHNKKPETYQGVPLRRTLAQSRSSARPAIERAFHGLVCCRGSR